MPGRLETVPQGAGSRGVYLITHPRSASNMFQTMMSKQPGYHNSSYKFFNAGFAMLTQIQKGPLSTWPEEQRNALYGAFRSGFDSMQDELEEVQKNVSLKSVSANVEVVRRKKTESALGCHKHRRTLQIGHTAAE